MKKILLGLVAISAIAMGFTEEQKNSQVKIRTIAEIDLNEGIVILPENLVDGGILLDHEKVAPNQDVSAGVQETVEIGLLPAGEDPISANLNNLQKGWELRVTIEAEDSTIGNRLVYADGVEDHYIGHELSATLNDPSKITGSIAGTTAQAVATGSELSRELATYTITEPVIPQVTVKSVLNQTDVNAADQAGLYSNTSLLKVNLTVN